MKKKILISIIIIAILAVVLIGGVFAYYYSAKISNSKIQSSNQVQNPNAQTAGLKTYKNDEYRFEFQYPDNAIIDVIKQNPNSETKSSRITVRMKSSASMPLERDLYININERINMNPCLDITKNNPSATQVLINGINFYKADVSSVYSGNQTRDYADGYCIAAGQFEYSLTPIVYYSYLDTNPPARSILENDVELNQIISTFKFTK